MVEAEDNFCVNFSDSGNDQRKRLCLPRRDFLAQDSCFKAAAELSGHSVDFKPTTSKNIAILRSYLRTGKISGDACSAGSLHEIVNDLVAWSVPQERWPATLQIVVANVQWWQAVEESLKINLEVALKAWLQECPNELLVDREMIANIRRDSKAVEVLHWEKFKSRPNYEVKMVPYNQLPRPSSEFKERIGRCFPGMKIDWSTVSSAGPHNGNPNYSLSMRITMSPSTN